MQMKKFTLLAALLILALGVLIVPAAAQAQVHDLTTLAQYFPADAPVYLSFRTDDDFIAQLDKLAAKFGSLMPNGQMPGSLQAMLDQMASQLAPNGTFASTIRSW